jgi:hypothetical protein
MYSILFYVRCLFLGVSGSVGLSFAFRFSAFLTVKLKLSNDIFLKSCQHKHTIDQCYSDA